MAKFANERKGGKRYLVVVSDTKHGQELATIPVKAMDPPRAKREAVLEAERRQLVIDPSRLYAKKVMRAA
jgi:hypothetical protein